MEITDIRLFPVNQDKLRAFVSIVLDNCFVVGDIKIISGSNGLFISMPSKRRKDGTFRDIAHPLNRGTRLAMEQKIEVGDKSDIRSLVQEPGDHLPMLDDAFPG